MKKHTKIWIGILVAVLAAGLLCLCVYFHPALRSNLTPVDLTMDAYVVDGDGKARVCKLRVVCNFMPNGREPDSLYFDVEDGMWLDGELLPFRNCAFYEQDAGYACSSVIEKDGSEHVMVLNREMSVILMETRGLLVVAPAKNEQERDACLEVLKALPRYQQYWQDNFTMIP